jgi:YD repeat-containing protein
MPPVPSANVGKPVNVTNGNMWIEHTDYELPGVGEFIKIDRFYNSMIQTSGLFGLGWSTKYDESLQIYSDDKMIRLNAPDGRASYFGRSNTSSSFTSFSQGMDAQITKNTDGTYTVTYKDRRVNKFNSGGQLLFQQDRNGNQTTLNYSGLGVLTGITDAVGRTLTISIGSNGNVSQISDVQGVVATYEYYPSTNLLKTVTYNDGSKYKFEYTTISSKTYITTVKDALDNILETHAYDSQGRAITSEKDGGVDKYTIEYGLSDFFLGSYSKVTDGLGRESKYFFTRVHGTNLVTRAEDS